MYGNPTDLAIDGSAFWAGHAVGAVETIRKPPEVEDISVMDLYTLGVYSLKIDICACNRVKVRQPRATVWKGVNFGVQWLQRFVTEN